MYSSILLDKDNFDGYQFGDNEDVLRNLNRINIFIGPNNSGKSRFLRSIFNHSQLNYTMKNIDLIKYSNYLDRLNAKISQYGLGVGIQNDMVMRNGYLNKNNTNSILDSYKKIFEVKNSIEERFRRESASTRSIQYRVNQIFEYSDGVLDTPTGIDKIEFEFANENDHFIYIPTLRGLRGLNYDKENTYSEFDNYAHRTKIDYFNGKIDDDKTVYTGLKLYSDVKELLLGNKDDREKIRKFEEFIGDTFFGGKSFNIIPSISDNAVHISIDNKDDKAIYKLGDGIQSLIILTYPLYFNIGKKVKVFFEEPDLFLHPGFQRIFMETLSDSAFKNFQFFFTTHSNHFLDMTLDYSNISVYAFSQIMGESKFQIDNVESNDSDVLQQLGVRNSSVFLTNCTIWVEGISDRIYLRKILELILNEKEKKYFEDVHYSFVEYGGNNITHWSFLDSDDESNRNINVDRLCGKVFLISDSDDAKGKKKKRQELLKAKLGENFYLLQCREIENLLLKDTILETVRAQAKEENRPNVKFKKGARLASNTMVGNFIDSFIEGRRKNYKAESGTVLDKAGFAKSATSVIDSLDCFSTEAVTLAEKLYNFIEYHNI